MKIYTKTGDFGETGLVGGKRLKKDSTRIRAYGEVDELNATLGMCRCEIDKAASVQTSGVSKRHEKDSDAVFSSSAGLAFLEKILHQLQAELFDLGADLATPPEEKSGKNDETSWAFSDVLATQTSQLEQWIDELETSLEPLHHFILPGGSAPAAYLHLARTVCRRAERSIVALMEKEAVDPRIIPYVNRLSDLLFVMARYANVCTGIREEKWMKKG